MILKALYLSRQASYDKFPNMITGKVTFDSPNGELTINIRPEVAGSLIKLLAAEMVATATVVAEDLTQEILDQANTFLEAPKVVETDEVQSVDDIPF